MDSHRPLWKLFSWARLKNDRSTWRIQAIIMSKNERSNKKAHLQILPNQPRRRGPQLRNIRKDVGSQEHYWQYDVSTYVTQQYQKAIRRKVQLNPEASKSRDSRVGQSLESRSCSMIKNLLQKYSLYFSIHLSSSITFLFSFFYSSLELRLFITLTYEMIIRIRPFLDCNSDSSCYPQNV